MQGLTLSHLPQILYQWNYKSPSPCPIYLFTRVLEIKFRSPCLEGSILWRSWLPNPALLACFSSLFHHIYMFMVCDDQRQLEGVWLFPSTLFVLRIEFRWPCLLVSVFIPQAISPTPGLLS